MAQPGSLPDGTVSTTRIEYDPDVIVNGRLLVGRVEKNRMSKVKMSEVNEAVPILLKGEETKDPQKNYVKILLTDGNLNMCSKVEIAGEKIAIHKELGQFHNKVVNICKMADLQEQTADIRYAQFKFLCSKTTFFKHNVSLSVLLVKDYANEPIIVKYAPIMKKKDLLQENLKETSDATEAQQSKIEQFVMQLTVLTHSQVIHNCYTQKLQLALNNIWGQQHSELIHTVNYLYKEQKDLQVQIQEAINRLRNQADYKFEGCYDFTLKQQTLYKQYQNCEEIFHHQQALHQQALHQQALHQQALHQQALQQQALHQQALQQHDFSQLDFQQQGDFDEYWC